MPLIVLTGFYVIVFVNLVSFNYITNLLSAEGVG